MGIRHARRISRLLPVAVAVLAVAAVAVVLAPDAFSRELRRVLTGKAGAARSAPASTPKPTARATPKPSTPPTATVSPDRVVDPSALDALVARYPAGATSVAAYDLTTGARVQAGATSGMTTASVVKVELLESLLLQHVRDHTYLTDDEDEDVTAMIENSDNGAAEDVFEDIGGHDAVAALEPSLGLDPATTVLGDDDYWGLTTTSAMQQLVLLQNLASAESPLDAASRSLALSLMRDVEADQRWGVPVAATSGDTAVKNGWLAVDDDGDLWAVNSVGVLTVGQDTVLVAVMTQHDDDMDDGIDRVQALARAAVHAVTRS